MLAVVRTNCDSEGESSCWIVSALAIGSLTVLSFVCLCLPYCYFAFCSVKASSVSSASLDGVELVQWMWFSCHLLILRVISVFFGFSGGKSKMIVIIMMDHSKSTGTKGASGESTASLC